MMKTSIRLIAMFAVFLPMLALAGPVNVNTADAATIAAELKGVGLSKAQAIVEYRKKHGPFRSAEDLTLVKGIGERTLDLNKSDIKVTSDTKK
jgi:competence protein ComEA